MFCKIQNLMSYYISLQTYLPGTQLSALFSSLHSLTSERYMVKHKRFQRAQSNNLYTAALTVVIMLYVQSIMHSISLDG